MQHSNGQNVWWVLAIPLKLEMTYLFSSVSTTVLLRSTNWHKIYRNKSLSKTPKYVKTKTNANIWVNIRLVSVKRWCIKNFCKLKRLTRPDYGNTNYSISGNVTKSFQGQMLTEAGLYKSIQQILWWDKNKRFRFCIKNTRKYYWAWPWRF